jgi:cell fate (sporulation/competence/biofilm development) regulator YlbF (YheA/YmcA/DUF963 family)
METKVPTLEEKTRELCNFLLEDGGYAAAQGKINAFEEDKEAQELYRNWQRKGSELQHMHQEGREPGEEDIAEMERLKGLVMDHSIGSDFIEAEETLNSMFGTVMKMVQKTLQDGAVPSDEDLDECCGNGGCGCN